MAQRSGGTVSFYEEDYDDEPTYNWSYQVTVKNDKNEVLLQYSRSDYAADEAELKIFAEEDTLDEFDILRLEDMNRTVTLSNIKRGPAVRTH